MPRGDGLFRRKYTDRHGKRQTTEAWWHRDPVSRKQESTGYKDREAAKRYHIERQRIAADPAYAAASAAEVGEWAQELIRVKRMRKAAGTVHMYTVKIGHIVRVFGSNRKLATIIPSLVDKYIETRESEGAHPSTIGKELTALNQMLKLAKRDGKYPHDVRALRPVDFSTEYEPGERALLLTEIETLRKSGQPQRFAAAFAIIATSCRDGELKRLRREDYNQATGIVHIRGTKTEGAKRSVPVLSIFRATFERHVLPYLPITYAAPGRVIGDACVRAGLERATSNDMRRTCATLMAAAGVPFDLAAKIMGHVNSDMLRKVYVKLAPEQLQSAAERHLLPPTEASVQQTEPLPAELCSGGFITIKLNSCWVAPSGLEPERSFDRGILKPRTTDRAITSRRVSRGMWRTPCSPGCAEFGVFGASVQQTDARRALARTAARLGVLRVA